MGHVAHRAACIRLAVLCSILTVWDLAPPLLIGVAVDVVVTQEDLARFLWRGPVAPTAGARGGDRGHLGARIPVRILVRRLVAEPRAKRPARRHGDLERVLGHAHRGLMNGEGDLLAVLNDDVNQLERFLDKGANDLLQVGTTVIVVGAISSPSPGRWPCWPSCPSAHPVGVLPLPARWSEIPERS